MQLFFNISDLYAIAVSATIVILYSSFGGIKSVTFTDVLQFITFSVMIPLICIVIWRTTLDNPWQVFNTVSTHPLFDLNKIMSIDNPQFLQLIFLLLIFIIPGIDPATFQRISMAGKVNLSKRSFIISGCVFAIIVTLVCWTGVILLSGNPNLDPDNMLSHVLNNYTYAGLKGLTAMGIMATIMSTADSYINCATVLVTHDLIKVYNTNYVKPKSELLLLRFVGLSIGIIAIFFAYNIGNLFHLILKTLSFYMPIVSVPLLLSLFGFQSNSKVVITGMIAGASVVILWSIYGNPEISEAPIAMMANLITFIILHLICGRPQIISKQDNIKNMKHPSFSLNITNWFSILKNFDSIKFFKWILPLNYTSYFFVGFFGIITIMITSQLMPLEKNNSYEFVLDKLYISSLICASVLITKPIWYKYYQEKFLIIFQTISIPYILVFVPLVLFLINPTGQISILILITTVLCFVLLARWQFTLLIIILIIFTFEYIQRKLYIYQPFDNQYINIKYKIFYLVISVSAVLIAFLKPKQKQQDLVEEKNNHLDGRIESQEKQLREALALRGEFIRNISHEYHAPMTGITTMADVLVASYDKLSSKQIRSGLETIVKSSRRLDVFDSNISSLAALSKAGYELKLKPVNLSDLLNDRIELCRKLYEENKEDREFILDIEDGVILNLDENYLKQTLDNLIINAISYCQKGKITVILKSNASKIICTICDEGIGIPLSELADIFNEFTVGSRTWTPAGGRGVGLALCKKVIEVHGGTISAQSDGTQGAIFIVELPLK